MWQRRIRFISMLNSELINIYLFEFNFINISGLNGCVQGSPQWISLEFPEHSSISGFALQFQGEFNVQKL